MSGQPHAVFSTLPPRETDEMTKRLLARSAIVMKRITLEHGEATAIVLGELANILNLAKLAVLHSADDRNYVTVQLRNALSRMTPGLLKLMSITEKQLGDLIIEIAMARSEQSIDPSKVN